VRISAGALAVIQCGDQVLVQWNKNWNAYSLIGGHVEAGESFRECCQREITEELECSAEHCQVSQSPQAVLRFREFSSSAHDETEYEWQIFPTELDESVLQNLPANCAWVTPSQIERGYAGDGKPIARQLIRVLQA
jgi:8-oxo-dGTP pyrophosphatase MutT (NUDIX family)